MKLFKIIFIFSLSVAMTNFCYAQENKVAVVDVKLFYASENGITRLINALKSANSKFLSLTAEEKDKEFKRIAKKCRDSKDEATKNTVAILEDKEKVVCEVVKDIAENAKKFKEKQKFILLVDIVSCDYVSDLVSRQLTLQSSLFMNTIAL